jgi:ER membrane protein complex subunit 2
MVWKRKVALLRSLNRPTEAISQLTLLLDSFPTDAEAWAELSDLYLTQDMYSQAAFCLEELLLLQPNSYFVHVQYAEVCWGLGREGTAVKHWCRSVELCGDFYRGWFGLKMVPSPRSFVIGLVGWC